MVEWIKTTAMDECANICCGVPDARIGVLASLTDPSLGANGSVAAVML